ncbi:MAG: nucleoside recognition protein [Lachnospiraceae bacterium]|nr:nucleoside recognition protein [Lachnospiraceae bacterium]
MLNYLWAFMILVGIVFAAFTGNISAITDAAFDSAGEAISLCITMAGIMAFWMGLMEIAGQAGLTAKMTKGISPFLSFLFPRIPKDHPAREYIGTNLIANILGLGWACTPAGLKAMEALSNLQQQRGDPQYTQNGIGTKTRSASNEMCTFLIINISSLQLIPVNMIAFRKQYGSVDPASIILPAIIATACSTLIAVIYCKMKDRGGRI